MFTLFRWGRLFSLVATLLLASVALGQNETLPRTGQYWFDYDPTWKISERWSFDADASIRLINSDPFFYQLRLYPTMQFSPWKWMDLTGGVWFIYTNRFEGADLFETRPIIGIKVKKDIWRGIRLSNYLRMEFRIQRDLDANKTLTARRLRDRIQAMIPINHRSLSEDKTWYTFTDVEWFHQQDPEVDDGFNGRRRYRAGIAWRKNSTWTYQFFYGFQQTTSNLNRPLSNDEIFSFSLIHNIKQ